MKKATKAIRVFKPEPLPKRADLNDELNKEWKELNDLIWDTVGCVAEKATDAGPSAPNCSDLSYIWKQPQIPQTHSATPIQEVVNKDSRRIYISNIPFRYTSEDLIHLCEKIGCVVSAEIIYNDRGSKGFGFVSFFSEWAARLAIKALDGIIIEGRKIEVHPATPKEYAKKKKEEESSQLKQEADMLWQFLQTMYLKK